jgi:hypothetical protein
MHQCGRVQDNGQQNQLPTSCVSMLLVTKMLCAVCRPGSLQHDLDEDVR